MSNGAIEWFDSTLPLFSRLKIEVDFILEHSINDAALKVHSISSRVKERSSFVEKIERKAYRQPQNEIEDCVGFRIVCLFLADLKRLDDLIHQNFKVLRSENKIEGSVDDSSEFGYMSHHYICGLPERYSGPRYDDLKEIVFEVQCRTILMDAWANVSHYLDYKGEASIPSHLKRDFHALSGLFYVADKHFQVFFEEAVESRRVAVMDVSRGDNTVELNADTVAALLVELYPDRNVSPTKDVSEFVEELAHLGMHETIGQLRSDLLKGIRAAEASERDNPPELKVGNRYTGVGIARTVIQIIYPQFRQEKRDPSDDFDPYYNPYRELLDNSSQ
ncbi:MULTISPECIES: GTP pyrophosphokinase [Actinomadura]|uniref:GTP pyrophosphokinase family protein n=1 Tax=Actinomadura yumaensis TaxID=111807 RepID=A0ABW2CN35_9ACTN|nr:hypothetical protein [Actinomadura sp. J1-007]